MKKITVPFFDLKRQEATLHGDLLVAGKRVLSSGWYVLGNEVSGFETEFARYQGAKFAIGVASGTDAIKIALRALGIGQGDEVITVSNTAVPTVSGIRETGAIPVFADIDQYLTVDVSDIENKITPKTKAIAEKCVWAPGAASASLFAYCAVPHTFSNSSFLDEWHQGVFFTEDTWWQIDAIAGATQALYASQDHPDVRNPQIDPSGKFIAFIDGRDSSLWVLRVVQ
jgi:hypothetical protein